MHAFVVLESRQGWPTASFEAAVPDTARPLLRWSSARLAGAFNNVRITESLDQTSRHRRRKPPALKAKRRVRLKTPKHAEEDHCVGMRTLRRSAWNPCVEVTRKRLSAKFSP